METERADPADLAVLRTAFAPEAGARPGPEAHRRTGTGSASPLGWPAVRAFEAEHGVVLPEPYRTFVAEIADGWRPGPPEYGLMPLGEVPRDWGTARPVRELGRPFPLTESWFWEDDPRPAEEIDHLLGPVFDHGSLVLGTEGCGMYWHLVVTGPHRGHVWLITGEGAVPFGAPFAFTTADPGFTGWTRHWTEGRSWFDEA